jgi:putative transposase
LQWRWGILWWMRKVRAGSSPALPLTPWPIARPADWIDRVNTPLSRLEEEAMLRCIRRSQPFGAPQWQSETASRLGLESTFRPRGRPKKGIDGGLQKKSC